MIINSTNMNVYLGFFVVFLINLHASNPYVLVQVQRKDGNLSNVDAIIHKTVPTDQVDQLTKKINRKQFAEKPDINMRADDGDKSKNKDFISIINDEEFTKATSKDLASVLEMIMGSVMTYSKNEMVKAANSTRGGFRLADHLCMFGHPNDKDRATLRSYRPRLAYWLLVNFPEKGKPVNFRSDPKGPMMYELKSDHIIETLNTALSSKPMKRLIDTFSKQAATLFRGFKNNQNNDKRGV